MLNKDGLEAGQPVDFATLMRLKFQKKAKVEVKAPSKKAAKKETK